MAPITITQMAGLHTSPNPLDSPPGALQEALNCVVRRKGVIESRRGFARKNELPAFASAPHSSLYFHNGQLVVHSADSTAGPPAYSVTAWIQSSQTWLTVMSAVQRNPQEQRLRMVTAADRMWVADRATTKAQEFFLDGTMGSGVAGHRPPPDIDYQASNWTGTSGWFANTATVAYRYTFVSFVNGRTVESAPSGRFVVTNTTGGSRNVLIQIDFPDFTGTARPQYIRLYRSEQVLPPITVPSDELFLAAELPSAWAGPGVPQNITDTQPEALLGEPLYTNPITGNGILDANFPPPLGVDIALWDGRLWLSNTKGPSRAEVLLVGVGPANGVQAGDTITVFGATVTAVVGVPGAGQFSLVTFGSPAENVDGTARNVVTAFNNLASVPVAASYISTPDDAPGLMAFWKYTTDGSKAANVTVSRASAWQITQQTTQDPHTNGLAFSKPEQPDAFPPTNTLLVNTDAAEILRIAPLRDRLYVFKTDGVYVVSGSFPYRVDLLDGTCKLIAPDAVCACNDSLYALTSQGVVAIGESGARIVSLPVESELRGDWQGDNTTDDPLGVRVAPVAGAGRATFACPYESERLVYFWIDGTRALVLNTMFNTWTRHGPPPGQTLADAAVEPATDRMVQLSAASAAGGLNRVWWERKGLDRYDFADHLGAISGAIAAPSSNTITYGTLVSVLPPQPGDVLFVVSDIDTGAGENWQIKAAGRIATVGPGNSLTLEQPIAQTILASTVGLTTQWTIYRAIPTRITYSPITAGQPSMVKRFREATLHFTSYSVEDADILAETDMAMVPTAAPQPIEGPPTLWTATRAGPADAIPRENKRRLIPRDKQMGAQILLTWDVEEAFCTWALCGVSVETEGVSERNSR